MELNVKAKPQPKVDPYAALKKAHAEGKPIQWFDEELEKWIDLNLPPSWTSPVTWYRVKPEVPAIDPYAELKQAHAEGKQIQYLNIHGQWCDSIHPSWTRPVNKYRIKSAPGVQTVSLALYANLAKTTWWVGHKNTGGTWEKLINLTITDGVPSDISFKE